MRMGEGVRVSGHVERVRPCFVRDGGMVGLPLPQGMCGRGPWTVDRGPWTGT